MSISRRTLLAGSHDDRRRTDERLQCGLGGRGLRGEQSHLGGDAGLRRRCPGWGLHLVTYEVLYLPTLDTQVEDAPTQKTLRAHLLASHTNQRAGRDIGPRARLTHLALSHLAFFGEVTTEDWLTDVSGWDGRLTVAQDLQLISV